MSKTDRIDLSADRLISIAADCLENHSYISALKMLNKNAVLNGNDEDSFMLYAECFDDMGLYEKCVNGWFKYIDYAGSGADFAEAYEGLAVSYMNMGMDSFAAFYYNKLLIETDSGLTAEHRREIIEAFINTDKPGLRFVYPPRLADYSEEIDKGMELMRSSDFLGAIEQFSKVGEGNEKYLSARNFIAMCSVITDNNEQAEAECMNVLKHDPNNVQALTTLSAVKSQQHLTEEARELALKLLSLAPGENEDLYKIATVCCENGLHAEAYDLFCRLDERVAYDCALLFFKAVSAFNCGKVEKSLEIFDTLLTVYPNAVTADYWHDVVMKERKKPEKKRRTLEYFYRLPQDVCEDNVAFLSAFNSLPDGDAKKLSDETDVTGIIHWCLDEGGSNASFELKTLGALTAVKCGLDDTVRDILLDAFLPDSIKLEVLCALVGKNTEGEYGVVVCNLYRRVTLVPIKVGRAKRKLFLKAYAQVFSRFAMLENEYPYKLAAAAEKLYEKLERECRLDAVRSAPALAAAILKFSEINENGLTDEQICSFFGVTQAKVDWILGIEA